MSKTPRSKIQLCVVTFGMIIGIVGILHGISEILQGSNMVESNSVTALPDNWPNSELFTVLNGQPAFSILTGIPFSLLGSLAMLVSFALIFHSLFFLEKKNGLLIFALLNVGVALFGAGFGTPLMIGIPLVVVSLISRRVNHQKERNESADRLILILFFPGFVIISLLGSIPEPLFLFGIMIIPVSILGALIFGLRYDNTFRPPTETNPV